MCSLGKSAGRTYTISRTYDNAEFTQHHVPLPKENLNNLIEH